MGHRLLAVLWKLCMMLGVAMSLAACSAGGTDTGTSLYNGGTDSGTDTGGTTSGSYTVKLAVYASGTAVSTFTSTATVQIKATVKDSSGKAAGGVLVSFSDSPALLTYNPGAATALTDTDGVATIDATPSAAGASILTASVTPSKTTYTGTTSVTITTASTVATEPAAINFIEATPSTSSIVIKGAGGNGRTEVALLKFQAVDNTGTPVSDATLNFAVSPASAATLSATSGKTDSSGYITIAIQSGSTAASVVVVATSSTNSAVSGKSDTVNITTGSITQAGFGIYAMKYNLDGTLIGDKTSLTAYLTDGNGNPVADGVAVTFTSDYNIVGTSSRGGCTTSNGQCTVPFLVGPPNGSLSTIVATANDGASTISSTLQINVASAPRLYASSGAASPIARYTMSSCTDMVTLYVKDFYTGRSAAAGTVVSIVLKTPADVGATIPAGATVLDSLDFSPTPLMLALDATASTTVPCKAGGTVKPAGYLLLNLKTPAGQMVYPQTIALSYPQ